MRSRSAGLAVGIMVGAAGAAFVTDSWAGMTPWDTKYSVKRYELIAEGMTAPLMSVDGGTVTAATDEKQLGGDGFATKHAGAGKFDPISIKAGIDVPPAFFKWVTDIDTGSPMLHNGKIVSGDGTGKSVHTLEFKNAIVVSWDFPVIDIDTKEEGYVTAKIDSESAKLTATPSAGTVPTGTGGLTRGFAATAGSVQFTVDGVDPGKIHRIDSLHWDRPVDVTTSGLGRTYDKKATAVRGTFYIEAEDTALTAWTGWTTKGGKDATLTFPSAIDSKSVFAVHFKNLKPISSKAVSGLGPKRSRYTMSFDVANIQ
jgi:hypothetical protein